MGKALIWAMLSLSLFAFSDPALADQPIVAVFRIEDKTRTLKKEQIEQYTEYLGTCVAKDGTFRRVPSDQVMQALMDQSKKSHKECYDQSCQIELGRALSANKSLSTRVMKLGDKCTMTAELYDLRTQATDVTASAESACKEAELKRSVEQISTELRAYGAKTSGSAKLSNATQAVSGSGKKKRILRLYEFKNLKGNKEDEWVARAIQEGLESAIGKGDRFDLLDSSEEYRKAEIANAINEGDEGVQFGKRRTADSVGNGTYVVLGENVQITCKITEVSTSTILSTGAIKGPVSDIPALAEELAKSLVHGLK